MYYFLINALKLAFILQSGRKANVVPIHKKGNRQSRENYRPISLLPIFGKIFEMVIFDAMYKHLCDNRLLTPNQSGF